MIEDYLRRHWVVTQLRASLLGPGPDELALLGYTARTVQEHLHAAGHLAHWLERNSIGLESLNEATTRRFATMAMHEIHSGVDLLATALWLGHQSTETTYLYIEAILTMEEEALKKLQYPPGKILRFRPNDLLLAFL